MAVIHPKKIQKPYIRTSVNYPRNNRIIKLPVKESMATTSSQQKAKKFLPGNLLFCEAFRW